VIAVGGTTLHITARGYYQYEYAWGGVDGDGAGGGGVSAAFGLPSFQSSVGRAFSGRAIPDISMDADPISGVAVYSANDESINRGDPWFQIGGISLASPMFAGVIALAQQNRIDVSLPIPNSVLSVTGSKAVTGYDLATGIGSPIGNEIVSRLS
jgi:subtilase family serine protease